MAHDRLRKFRFSLLPAIQATRLLTFASRWVCSPTKHTCFFLVALPYGGFSPVRLQGRLVRQGLPVRRNPRVEQFACVLRAPRCPRRIPVLCRGTWCAGTPPFERLLPLYPRGPRSGPSSSVSVHPRLIGPIRPTHRHISSSPLCSLYEMPSLCTLRLGDLRVVPRFRCPSFLTCRPLRPRGDRNRFVPDLSGSALPTILQSASRRADFWGLPGSLLLRPVKLLAPCADLTRVLPATGTFTSRLPTSRSPFSPLDITTTVTGLFCRRDSHPLE